jgi:hypothetical protein
MKTLRTLLLCSCAIFLASCTRHLVPVYSVAGFSSPVKESFSLTTNSAVVYGRFALDQNRVIANQLALRLCEERSQKVYLIPCRAKESVYAVEVLPGRYRLEGYLGTSPAHRPRARHRFTDAPIFDVRSNSLTYLGDFAGYAKVGFGTEEWGLSAITINFEATTDELRQKYPNLASNPTYSIYDEGIQPLKAVVVQSASGVPAGDYRLVDSKGSTEAKGRFTDGKMDGLWVFSGSDGTKFAEISYNHGIRSGPYRLYWSGILNPTFAGKLKVEGQAQNGKIVGEHVVYRPDGQVDSRATILDDGQIQPSIGSRELAQNDLKADERYLRTLERAVLDAVADK